MKKQDSYIFLKYMFKFEIVFKARRATTPRVNKGLETLSQKLNMLSKS